MRIALVAAPCARLAIAALTALCAVPAAALAADLTPCGDARCGSLTVPLFATDPTAGTAKVGFEVYAHRKGSKPRDIILVSAGSDGVPTTANRVALLALLAPLRERSDIVLVDARGTGRSGRVGPQSEAYNSFFSAVDLDAVRSALGATHVELYTAGDGTRIGIAYNAIAAYHLRALVLDGGPAAVYQATTGTAETRALAKALGAQGEATVGRLAAKLRSNPIHAHGRIDDDVLARMAVTGDARTLGELPAAAAAALKGDTVPLARLVAESAPLPGRQAAQARASSCGDDLRPDPTIELDGGPFTSATWLRALGLAACKRWSPPTGPFAVVPGSTQGDLGKPILMIGGEHAVQAPTSSLRRLARALKAARVVRVRGAAASPALNDPDGCAGTIVRSFLETRGRLSPGCASRPAATQGMTAFPLTMASAPAALRDARAHGRDRSTLADRRAATVAALGVADALASAQAPGAPATVKGLRGGSATVTRRGTVLTLTLRGMRFARDVALDGLVTNDAKTGSVYAALSVNAADGTQRALVLTWNAKQAKGFASARGSADGRSLLLVLRAP